MSNIRMCRAVEANVGERRAYQKQLVRLFRSFQRYVLGEVLTELEQRNMLVYDAKPLDPSSPNSLREAKRKVLRAMQTTAGFEIFLTEIVGKNMQRWVEALRSVSENIATKFVKKAMSSTSRAQRAALIAAGVKPSTIKKAFTVPTVGRQYITPAAAQIMQQQIRQNVELITKIGAADVERITSVLTTGLQSGLDYSKLLHELDNTKGFDSARADRVALDQLNKINQQTQILNAQELGCTHARWKHVPGQYTSRRSHLAMNGKIFKLGEGLYDPEAKQQVIPGQLPFCRCVCRLVVPEEITDE